MKQAGHFDSAVAKVKYRKSFIKKGNFVANLSMLFNMSAIINSFPSSMVILAGFSLKFLKVLMQMTQKMFKKESINLIA